MRTRFMLLIGLTTALGAVGGCQSDGAGRDGGARLYDGMGNHSRVISTDSAEAQRYFDQGLQLTFGFNHDEAIRSFRRAAALDPGAAMPWWGVAYCNGININDPQMGEQRSRDAWDATRRAMANIERASPTERALIGALSARYAWPRGPRAVPGRRRRRGAVRRVADEPAAVGLLDPRRRAEGADS